jgi:hypothetical protein
VSLCVFQRRSAGNVATSEESKKLKKMLKPICNQADQKLADVTD